MGKRISKRKGSKRKMKINPLLESDFYKQVHCNQYPKDVAKVVSYFTPRMTRLEDQGHLIMFGLQGFIKEFLIDTFNTYFFNRSREEVVNEAKRLLGNTIACDCSVERYGQLHDLGYLPIEIKALPEGTRVPIQVPMFEISNTHPEFAWLTNALESVISAEMWHPMVSANVGYEYRKIVNMYYDETCDDTAPRRKALGDFSMRGQESRHSAYKSSAGWLLSHVNTATVPAIAYMEEYYNADSDIEEVGYGSPSTEHSVMCSNYSVDGDEITMVKRLLTEIYPNNSFSMVSDSYDYWNLVNNILPQCRKEIEEHNGCLLVRGDSGDPVQVVTETVFRLGELFGYSVNSKGYKVLNPKVKAIYGDSITLTRAKQIYQILKQEGWAASNVALGVGSFSMQCLEEEQTRSITNYKDEVYTVLKPFTRDTFGIAIKATHVVMKDGTEHFVFKNPKEGGFKKSQKGCCIVLENEGKLICNDGHKFNDTYSIINKMEVIFKNGKMVKEYSLKEIRDRLWEGRFYE